MCKLLFPKYYNMLLQFIVSLFAFWINHSPLPVLKIALGDTVYGFHKTDPDASNYTHTKARK